jgi:hypothetical protein
MNFKFNELRTIQAVSLLLNLSGGKINSSKLMMLLYIIDNDLLVKHGSVLTGDKYVKTQKGIILCEVKNRLNKSYEYPLWLTYFDFRIKNDQNTLFTYVEPNDGELSDLEHEMITKVQKEFEDYDDVEMQEILYDCFSELKDTSFYGLITHEMIMSMNDISDSEIKELSDTVQYHNDVGDYFDSLKKIH